MEKFAQYIKAKFPEDANDAGLFSGFDPETVEEVVLELLDRLYRCGAGVSKCLR